MLRDSMDMVIRWRSDFGNTKDPSGITFRISLTISSWKEWITLLKMKTITMGPPARCARHDITLLGYTKSNVTVFGKVPTIIFGRDSVLIGVRIPQTHDAWEGRGATQFDEMELQDSREMNYGSEIQNKSSSLSQGEDEEVADRLSDNSSRFLKDVFPQSCEQGDNIGHTEVDNKACSRRPSTSKHWSKRAPGRMD